MKYNLLFWLLITIAPTLPAQQQKLMRIELPSSESEDQYHLKPMGDQGFALITASRTPVADQQRTFKQTLTIYNTELNIISSKTFAMPEDMKLQAMETSQGKVAALYYNDRRNGSSPNVRVIWQDITTDTLYQFTGIIAPKGAITHFRLSGSLAIIGMMNHHDEAQLYRLQTQRSNIAKLDLPTGHDSRIEAVMTDSSQTHIYAIVQIRPDKLTSQFALHRFTIDGLPLNHIPLTAFRNDHPIQNIEIRQTAPQQWFFCGTWELADAAYNLAANLDERTSTGIVAGTITPDSIRSIHYHHFGDFENIYRFLDKKNVLTLKKKMSKQVRSGTQYSYAYHLITHPIINRHGTNIFLTEAFFPEYHTVTSMRYDYYGRPMPSTYTVFDGYRRTYGLVAGLDNQGQLIWDNGIDMGNVLENNLYPKLHMQPLHKKLLLAYINKGRIHSATINKNAAAQTNESVPLSFARSRDKLISSRTCRIEPWYNGCWIAFGYQRIRNQALAENKRNVFYISKLVFE